MQQITRSAMGIGLLMVTLALGGCDGLVDTSKAASSITKRAFENGKSSWVDLFTYHEPQPEPLPQTRYCYQMQSDIVCYDSQQPGLTAKLAGYQDGENISGVQPGGGSLGVSGGPAVALRPVVVAPELAAKQARSTSGYTSAPMIDTGPVMDTTPGQISVTPLEAKKK